MSHNYLAQLQASLSVSTITKSEFDSDLLAVSCLRQYDAQSFNAFFNGLVRKYSLDASERCIGYVVADFSHIFRTAFLKALPARVATAQRIDSSQPDVLDYILVEALSDVDAEAPNVLRHLFLASLQSEKRSSACRASIKTAVIPAAQYSA